MSKLWNAGSCSQDNYECGPMQNNKLNSKTSLDSFFFFFVISFCNSVANFSRMNVTDDNVMSQCQVINIGVLLHLTVQHPLGPVCGPR